MTKSALVGWYLSEVVGEELDSEEELAKRKYLVERVIDRLVNHVRDVRGNCVCVCTSSVIPLDASYSFLER